MLLKIKRDLLLKNLMLITGLLDKKHTMPILSNVYLKKVNNELIIVANDLEIQASINCATDNDSDDFIITLPGKKLQEILKMIPSNAVVTLEQQDNMVVIKSEQIRYTIQSMQADYYPLLKLNGILIGQFTIIQNLLKQMINKVYYAMADKDGRIFLNGMLFAINNNQLNFVATDAHRLSFVSDNITETIAQNYNVILPRKTVLELLRILEDNTELVLIKLYNNQIYFEINNKQLITKIIDGRYPNYTKVIPIGNDKLCFIDRLALLNALDRVAIISVDKMHTVVFELSYNLLVISCSNEYQEQSYDELSVQYNYQDSNIKACFNLSYIKDILMSNNAHIMQLAVFDNMRSLLITIPNDDNFKAVIMPLRN